jgi:spermidine/putrescine transport system substrate-binding protein
MKPIHLMIGTVSAIAMASAAAAQDADLLVFDYSGYEDPAYHGAYIAAHGDSPTFAFFGDEDEAFQKVVSGFEADITHICAGSVTKWVDSGIVEPWDTSRIDAFAELNTDLTGTSVGGDGGLYFLPIDYGSTAVAYIPSQVPAADVASLNVFKNPAYAGRMTIPDNVDDAYALAYLATGVSDWSTATDAQFEAASNWLRDVHPNLRTYWQDAAELAQLMSSGEILVSWAWNETPPTMREEDREVGFNRETAEGTSLWVCGYVNLKDAPGSEDKAYDYVNAMLAQESVEPLLDAGFGSANTAALNAVVTAEGLVDAGLEPVSVPVLAQLPIPNALREKHNETFELIKAGF